MTKQEKKQIWRKSIILTILTTIVYALAFIYFGKITIAYFKGLGVIIKTDTSIAYYFIYWLISYLLVNYLLIKKKKAEEDDKKFFDRPFGNVLESHGVVLIKGMIVWCLIGGIINTIISISLTISLLLAIACIIYFLFREESRQFFKNSWSWCKNWWNGY